MTDFFGSVRSIELQNTSLTEGEVDAAVESGRGSDAKWVGQDTPLFTMLPEDTVVSGLYLLTCFAAYVEFPVEQSGGFTIIIMTLEIA